MSSRVFHLGVNQDDLQGASLAILPGDSERVEKIAILMDQPEFLAAHREYVLYRAKLAGQTVIVCSTGIGGPSTSIVVEELAQLGIRDFLRAGTTGAIQPSIAVGDLVVTTGAVRLDGASYHFAPAAFPAVADYYLTQALEQAVTELHYPLHLGVTASSDTFYPGQERYDTVSGRVLKSLQGSMAEWQAMGVLNYEMESATLLTQCASQGFRAGCIAGVIVNRMHQETPDISTLTLVETRVITAVIAAAERLLLSGASR